MYLEKRNYSKKSEEKKKVKNIHNRHDNEKTNLKLKKA